MANVSSKLAIYPNLIDTCISDHKTVYIDLDIPKPVAQKSVYIDLDIPKPVAQKSSFIFRSLNKINFTDLNNDITAAFSNFEYLDLNSLVSHFNLTLSSLLAKHILEKTVYTTTRFYNP